MGSTQITLTRRTGARRCARQRGAARRHFPAGAAACVRPGVRAGARVWAGDRTNRVQGQRAGRRRPLVCSPPHPATARGRSWPCRVRLHRSGAGPASRPADSGEACGVRGGVRKGQRAGPAPGRCGGIRQGPAPRGPASDRLTGPLRGPVTARWRRSSRALQMHGARGGAH